MYLDHHVAVFSIPYLSLSSFDQTVQIISSFPSILFVIMLFLHLLLSCKICEMGIPIKKIESVAFPGKFLYFRFSMTLTPAKIGELIKPCSCSRLGHDSSRIAPVVLIERLTDLWV